MVQDDIMSCSVALPGNMMSEMSPANPDGFKAAVEDFARSVHTNFTIPIEANPEDQLKAPTQAFLQAVSADVQARTEAQVEHLGARPDIGVAVRMLLCGYIELKAPGKGARTGRYTGADRKQWQKFKALPNLIYTDGAEWALYRSGELLRPVVRISADITDKRAKLDEGTFPELHAILVDFLNWAPVVPDSSQSLAKMLAPLCHLLREDVSVALTKPDSALTQLAREWRQYLFPDADDAQFADAYAQTLTYALLLARLNGEEHLNTRTAADALDTGHGLLAQALRILTQPEARNEIAVPVDILERVIRAVEPERLRERGDPWLYFYEHFLSIYDQKLRNSYGVYYTPIPVIEAQVRLVSELLIQRFNKPLSYADRDVVFLDPAAGTAAYPLAAIEHGLDIVAQRFGEGMVATKASDCANNIFAFEILVGPYAVSHLRLTKLFNDKGATLPPEGVHVLLTDTLESPHSNPPQPPLFARVLTEEHRRAQRVKSRTRVLVCMGNPPYDREQYDPNETAPQHRKGGWVRFGDTDDPHNRPILQDFIEPALALPNSRRNVQNLYNDYVYFWRWALWKLFENPDANGPGIISFISASSYLRGPGFVGMRKKMREAFDELWIIDLEGDNLGPRKTENVFAIQTPVAIAVGVRYGDPQPNTPAHVRYAKLVGTKEEKCTKLDLIQSFANVDWQDCFTDWTKPFLPELQGDYFSWPLVTDIFPWQGCGAKFERNWPIGETQEQLEKRWHTLLAAPLEQKRTLFREDDDRKVDRSYQSLSNPAMRLPEISNLPVGTPPLRIVRYAWRSFDRQYAIADNRVGGRLNPTLWRAHSDDQVYFTSLLTQVLGLGPGATVSAYIPDLHHFNGRGGKDIIPLWRDATATTPNITRGLLEFLSDSFGRQVSPEDLFAYVYAILSSPSYTERFSEELSVPGPRLPVTKLGGLFNRGASIGRKLIWLHTYGERFVPDGEQRGRIPQGVARCRRGIPTAEDRYPEGFSYERESETLYIGDGVFSPVSAGIWDFTVSGLKVVESWLNYRMEAGAGRGSSPLDEIRAARWTGEMTQELLEVLWAIEATLVLAPDLDGFLVEVLGSDLFQEGNFPVPTAEERQRLFREPEPESGQLTL